jgi:hypothetical protein
LPSMDGQGFGFKEMVNHKRQFSSCA